MSFYCVIPHYSIINCRFSILFRQINLCDRQVNKAAYEGAKTLHFVDTSRYANIDVKVHKLNEQPVEVAKKEKKVNMKKLIKDRGKPSRRDPDARPRTMIDARAVVMDRSNDWEISGSRGDFE